jgi:hypothetical protein
MPRVHHRKARKDYPAAGIKRGDMYYTWKIKLARGGMLFRQLTPPRPSQLTNSPFTGPLNDLQDDLRACTDADGLRGIAESVRELGEEQQEKFDNMPEGLQQGDTGQLLEERAQGCESWADAIEQAADSLQSELDEIDGMDAQALELADDATDEQLDEAREAKRDEALQAALDEAESACEF